MLWMMLKCTQVSWAAEIADKSIWLIQHPNYLWWSDCASMFSMFLLFFFFIDLNVFINVVLEKIKSEKKPKRRAHRAYVQHTKKVIKSCIKKQKAKTKPNVFGNPYIEMFQFLVFFE